MPNSEFSALVERITAFDNTARFEALSSDDKMRLGGEVVKLIRKVMDNTDPAEEMRLAEALIAEYDIP